MTDSKIDQHHECTIEHCAKCDVRSSSPLCSVQDAHEDIVRLRTEVKFKSGQTIFYQGNEPLGLFVLQNGLVKLEANTLEGSSNTLRLLGPGQALGYRSMFAGEAYQASAICVEDCTLCFLPKNLLLPLVQKYPKVAVNLLHQLAIDLRVAEEKWITQVNKGAPERVAEALLFLHEHFQDQQWTRREIAQWAGTTPETVMRTLSQFEKDGLIESRGRAYHILDHQKLSAKTHQT